MLKVMIIDDEPTIIKGLSCLIDWQEYGFEISQTARSAVKALELLSEERPSLIITDVHMPKMTGIEFIEQVKSKYPDINIIIISGYDEFEYAKKAIDFQIDGYLLKPIDEDELIRILKRIRKRHIEHKAYMNQMLYSIIHSVGGIKPSDWVVEPELSDNSGFRYVQIKLTKQISINSSPSQTNDDIADIMDKVKSWLGNQFSYLAIADTAKSIGIVLTSELEHRKGGMESFIEEIKALIGDDLRARIFVGEQVEDICDINKSYASIRHLENVAFYNTDETVFVHDDCCDMSFINILEDDSFLSGFIDGINDGQSIDKCVEEMFAYIKNAHIAPEHFKNYINNIVIQMIKNVMDIGGDALPVTAKHSVFRHAQNIDVAVMELFLKDISKCYLQQIFDVCNSKGYIGEIADYIKTNYHEDITLAYFAKKYYLNSSYLGSMFKKKMGVSFNKYLANRRFDEAKKLLRNTDLKVFEIGMKVGFKDAGYFSRRFEETVGMTPNEYRRKVMENNNV